MKSSLLTLLSASTLALALPVSAQSVWYDDFTGSLTGRTTDGLGVVNSFEWYSGGPVGVGSYSYTNGQLVSTSERAALGYFTEPGQSVSLVNAGDRLTLTVNYRYTVSGGNTGDRLRIGLFQSVANPDATSTTGFTAIGDPNTNARVGDIFNNNSDGTVSSNFVNLYTGFSISRLTAKTSNGDVPAPNVSIFERVGGASANSVLGPSAGTLGTTGFNLLGTGGNAFNIGANWGTSVAGGVPLTLNFSILYQGIDVGTGKNIIDLHYSLTDGVITNSFEVLGHLTDQPLSFDTIGLYARGAFPSYDNMTVTLQPIPEPGTLALGLAGLGLLGIWTWRRRHDRI